MPDERLARWAARGSEAAFAVIFERHHQALHRYCHSIVGNGHDASDALQNTMLKAFRALSGETREITLRPWLYRIAHNESISLLRARRPDADLDSAAHVGDRAAEGLVESRDRLRALAADLTELTEQGRGALLMRELGGLEFAEIAAALGISPAAAKQSVYESRCVLQALQEGRDMDCDAVRRTLSDGDRRMLRGKRLRGHLSSCAGCQDFERGLRQRPAELVMLAPPLPLAAAAAMLSGLLGGASGGGFGAGGGLVASITGGAKAATGMSLATKVATVAVVGTTIVGGGALVVVPDRDAASPPARTGQAPAATGSAGAPVAAPRISPPHAPTSAGEAALVRENAARVAAAGGNGTLRNGAGAVSAPGRSQVAPGQTRKPGTSAAAQPRRGGSATALQRRAQRAAIARGEAGRSAGRAPARPPLSAAALVRAKTKALAEAKARARADARANPDAPTVGGASATSPDASGSTPRSPR